MNIYRVPKGVFYQIEMGKPVSSSRHFLISGRHEKQAANYNPMNIYRVPKGIFCQIEMGKPVSSSRHFLISGRHEKQAANYNPMNIFFNAD